MELFAFIAFASLVIAWLAAPSGRAPRPTRRRPWSAKPAPELRSPLHPATGRNVA